MGTKRVACSSCGILVESEDKYCRQCGKKFDCPSCEDARIAGNKFCGKCSKELRYNEAVKKIDAPGILPDNIQELGAIH